MALSSEAHILAVLRAWRDRGLALCQESPDLIHHILFFKNQGQSAGASLVHPHSQIVALPMVPKGAQVRQTSALEFYTANSVSIFQHILDSVTDVDGDRLVESNDMFVAFVPYAALSPFQVLIVPRFQSAQFLDSQDDVLASFAAILRSVLYRMHLVLDEPDFNLILRSSPLRRHQQALNLDTFFRWYAEINPRLGGGGALAGFEIGSGIFSNGNAPEDDALVLRDAFILGQQNHDP